jgi:hypothetical protein
MLLLMIAISALSLIYFQVLSDEGPPPTTIVKIVGRGEGKYVYLEHTGGETIDLDNTITYSIGGYSYPSTEIGDIIEKDESPVGVWNLGERLKIPIQYSLDQLDEFESAQITGIDTLSNSIIF